MRIARYLFVLGATIICGVAAADASESYGGLHIRQQRAVFDVNVLLRSLLQKSADLSNFKANVSRNLATLPPPPPPTTRRPRPPPPPMPPMPPMPSRRPTPRGRVGFNYGFGPFQKGAYLNFNYGDYGDYDVGSRRRPQPQPQPTQPPATRMPPPATMPPPPPPPPPPQPQPRPQRPPRPLPPPQRPLKPIYGAPRPGPRFGNPKFGRLPPASYDDYYDDQAGDDGDVDYPPAPQPPPAPPAPQPPPAPQSPPAPPAPRPQNVRPRAGPSRGPQLRNNLIFEFAQRDDTSSDGAAATAGNDGDAAGTRNGAAGADGAEGNTDADSNNNDAGGADGAAPPPPAAAPNDDANNEVSPPAESSAPPAPNLPTAPSQQAGFFDNPAPFPSSSQFGFGSFSSPGSGSGFSPLASPDGGGATFAFNARPPTRAGGSFQFRSPFADFKTTYAGGGDNYFQPSQYVSQAQGFYR